MDGKGASSLSSSMPGGAELCPLKKEGQRTEGRKRLSAALEERSVTLRLGGTSLGMGILSDVFYILLYPLSFFLSLSSRVLLTFFSTPIASVLSLPLFLLSVREGGRRKGEEREREREGRVAASTASPSDGPLFS